MYELLAIGFVVAIIFLDALFLKWFVSLFE